MKNKMGFTLVELMVVIVIIGILASAGMPTYRNKITRAKIESSIVYAEIAMEAIDTFYKDKKRFPKSNAEAKLPGSDKFVGKYVTSVVVDNGAIHITFGNGMHSEIGNILSIRPAIMVGEPIIPITWIYGNGAVPHKLTVQGGNRTSFASEALPFEYRF